MCAWLINPIELGAASGALRLGARASVCGLALWALGSVLPAMATSGRILEAGPGRPLTSPCAAIEQARDGDTILIDGSHTYRGDVCVLRASHVTLRAVGGVAVLDAAGQAAEGKGIWVIKGHHTTVEHIRFTQARVPDRNGAGIRLEGRHLVLRHCEFLYNENGLLTGDQSDSRIHISHTLFGHNGHGDGYSHNLYVGQVGELVFEHNHSHDAHAGHLLKSRARLNRIAHNRFTNHGPGASSYEVDLPNGGQALLVGNVIHQGRGALNGALVNHGSDRALHPHGVLVLWGNHFVNERAAGSGNVFVQAASPQDAVVWVDNVVQGPGQRISRAPLVDLPSAAPPSAAGSSPASVGQGHGEQPAR